MGVYLNPASDGFQESLNSEIYVDKSAMIGKLNRLAGTKQKYVCVSRPRWFGKTMALEMLAAYYTSAHESRHLFAGLAIEDDPSFEKHLGQYHVICLNIQEVMTDAGDVTGLGCFLHKKLAADVKNSQLGSSVEGESLTEFLGSLYQATGQKIVFLIDEWDCIFRIRRDDNVAHGVYLDFLRHLLKDRSYVTLAYMTGILPIKKYGIHSALSMFDEYSMTDPRNLAEYVGFTGPEVAALCGRYGMDFADAADWYDGYSFPGAPSVYCPRSVVTAMLCGRYSNYWTQTETYEALRAYIEMNIDGLRDDVVALLAGDRRRVNTQGFTNDMVTFAGKDDIFTLLVHLGYLGYDMDSGEVFVPNKEIADEFRTATGNMGWQEVLVAVSASDALLEATWRMDGESVAAAIEAAHMETSHLSYNDENALSYTVSLAYYSARKYYTIVREFPSGKGYADMVFLPRPRHMDKAAMVVELKWDKGAAGAIAQIKDKRYPSALADYKGNLLLVGLGYTKKTKTHRCAIERVAV
ncbi:MAG: ATP-binding protein [Lachnospiraceae bacterium]|nr:ATP-binding protein [Lachnospiraceae bacterium]